MNWMWYLLSLCIVVMIMIWFSLFCFFRWWWWCHFLISTWRRRQWSVTRWNSYFILWLQNVIRCTILFLDVLFSTHFYSIKPYCIVATVLWLLDQIMKIACYSSMRAQHWRVHHRFSYRRIHTSHYFVYSILSYRQSKMPICVIIFNHHFDYKKT